MTGETATPLTPREAAVLNLIASGLSNKAVAACLKISYRTVESHRLSCMKKLGARNVVQLVRYVLLKEST